MNHRPRTQRYDIDLGPILVVRPENLVSTQERNLIESKADHYHVDYYDSVSRALSVPQVFDVPVNSLINGRMDTNCLDVSSNTSCDTSQLTRYEVTPNKTYLLRLINAGSVLASKFSIDGHSLTVIANDYVSVTPYQTNVVTLGVGQRSDVLLRATGEPRDLVWMRSWPDYGCYDVPVEVLPRSLAVVSHPEAPKLTAPTSQMYPLVDNNCRNVSLSQAVRYSSRLTSEPRIP